MITLEEIQVWRRCRREHHYQFGIGRVPIQRSESFGELWRRWMRHWWYVGARPEDAEPYVQAKIDALFVGYVARWGETDREHAEPFERTSVSIPPFSEVEVSYDVRACGNAMVWRTTGDTIGPGAAYWDRWSEMHPDPGVIAFGGGPSVYVHDVVHKPQLRPSAKGETPEQFRKRVMVDIQKDPSKYFARFEVTRTRKEREDNAYDVHAAMVDMTSRNMDPYRNPDACVRFGSRCPYFDVCRGSASIDDDRLFQVRVNK